MSRYFYINEISRQLQAGEKVREGGLARNLAFMEWIARHVKDVIDIQMNRSHLQNLLSLFRVLMFSRDAQVVIQYPSVAFPFFSNRRGSAELRSLYLAMLGKAARCNQIVLDISDLKYEQAIDLEIDYGDINIIKSFEDQLFRLPLFFIFASESMRQYAIRKYSIELERTESCVNGGDIPEQLRDTNWVDDDLDPQSVNYVYSGTLNRGRQIEEMIRCFSDNCCSRLIIMGTNGDWIPDFNQNRHVRYLGPVEQCVAHAVVSRCDIGLVPYDESRLYYNLAFPTKLSFYLTAGIPFLTTPVAEVAEFCKGKPAIGISAPISQWQSVIEELDRDCLSEMRQNVESIKSLCTWDSIFNASRFMQPLDMLDKRSGMK